MTMIRRSQAPYTAKQFNLSGLEGISDRTLETHFGLYNGYVTNTNKLTEEIFELAQQRKVATPEYAELVRWLGFEYNGMILHEYYFGNLKAQGSGKPASSSPLMAAIEQSYGDWDTWLQEFKAIGLMRGVGWAIT